MRTSVPSETRHPGWWSRGAIAGLLLTLCFGAVSEVAVRAGCFRFMDECSGFPAIWGYLAAGLLATAGAGGLAVWQSQSRPLPHAATTMVGAATASTVVATLMFNLTAEHRGTVPEIAAAVFLGGPFFIGFYLILSLVPVVLLSRLKPRTRG